MARIIRPKAKAQCPHCNAIRIIFMEKHQIGDMIHPFPGGGNYGKCLRCKRTGLKIVEIPEPVIKKPIGWHHL